VNIYSCRFYIAEEKRFTKWEDYLAYYRKQDKEIV